MVTRIQEKFRRSVATWFSRRIVPIKTRAPLISFCFDDAPQTAFRAGGEILKEYGLRGTYYVSLGLLGLNAPTGAVAAREDLLHAAADGFELGCHTFDHLEPWSTPPDEFETSVLKNRQALSELMPDASFRTFAYPLKQPRPSTKSRIGKHFLCCRGGGQRPNVDSVDLNLLKAYFLDKRNRNDSAAVKRIIDYNSNRRGWLILATHDIADNPSPYGCTARFFESIVEHALNSTAIIQTVDQACQRILAP